ncbi:hypothetical protein E6O75_ATG08352 [Venturia nashicola]|uniref:Uncharacterized protein n=1 Tax=Venturia nashicola TaxID=86259 RepID=A0A4Z1NHA2_9PEZI|nr:hypothetical protein E6O75_ATG08352 [Venturia nashicola]
MGGLMRWWHAIYRLLCLGIRRSIHPEPIKTTGTSVDSIHSILHIILHIIAYHRISLHTIVYRIPSHIITPKLPLLDYQLPHSSLPAHLSTSHSDSLGISASLTCTSDLHLGLPALGPAYHLPGQPTTYHLPPTGPAYHLPPPGPADHLPQTQLPNNSGNTETPSSASASCSFGTPALLGLYPRGRVSPVVGLDPADEPSLKRALGSRVPDCASGFSLPGPVKS